jgi:hypothetical protein
MAELIEREPKRSSLIGYWTGVGYGTRTIEISRLPGFIAVAGFE